MKKNLILGFIAFTALTITSCTNDVVNELIPQEKAITFNSYLGRDAQTRGSVVNATTLQTSGFGVFAYQHTGTVDYSDANFMNNIKVSGNNWGYNPIKYWPTDTINKIDFLAYGPYNESVDFSTGELTFTVNDTVANQTDLVVATPKKNMTSESGLVDEKVQFTFKHMLSRIAFFAQSAADYASTKITITNVTLSGNFYSAGTVNLSNDSPSITGRDTQTGKNYSPGLTGIELTEELVMQNNNTDYLMVIPQDAQNLTLSITYNVTDGNGTVTNTLTKQIAGQSFDAGTAYAFNLSVALNAISFSVAEFGWGDETPIPGSGTTVF